MLNSPEVHPGPQAPRRKCRPELVQPEILFIEFSSFRTCFQAIQKVQLRVAPRRWEHQPAGLVRLRLPGFQRPDEFRGDRYLTFLVGLGCPISIGLVADTNY